MTVPDQLYIASDLNLEDTLRQFASHIDDTLKSLLGVTRTGKFLAAGSIYGNGTSINPR